MVPEVRCSNASNEIIEATVVAQSALADRCEVEPRRPLDGDRLPDAVARHSLTGLDHWACSLRNLGQAPGKHRIRKGVEVALIRIRGQQQACRAQLREIAESISGIERRILDMNFRRVQ